MNNIETQRELAKHSLEMFFLDLENNYHDRISDEAIQLFEQKIKEAETKDRAEEYKRGDYSGSFGEVFYLENELKAICEMKIIYTYKHFENKLNYLLSAAYGVSKTKLFKWEFVVQYLKERNIDIKKVKGSSEINELRNLNNAIKHSDDFQNDNRIEAIKEFSMNPYPKYTDFLVFYKRIEKAPLYFISSLSDFMYKDLYVFDEDRLDKEAEKIALRMNEKEANVFIEKLKNKY